MRISGNTLTAPRVRFPRDEGAHPGVKTEWWYLHGYLEDEQGKKYGFHHALFDAPDVIDGRYNVDFPAMPGAMALDAALTEETEGRHTQVRHMKVFPPYWPHRDLKADRLDERYGRSFHVSRWDSQTIRVEGVAGRGQLDLELKELKPPLLMGGEGEIPMGPYGRSKYYTFP
ncbi:MAG: lipocalin-like domain-containing protein, partial [Candidatus Eremiobacterota bacterium]